MVGEEVRPYLPLVQKLGTVVAALASKPPASIVIRVRGELANEDVTVLPLAALRGVFAGMVDEQVTFVNAPKLAEDLGVAHGPGHRAGERQPPQPGHGAGRAARRRHR